MKHLRPIVLNSRVSREKNKESVAAAMELLSRGTTDMPCEVIPSVSDAVGRNLCRIGSTQNPVSPGSRSGKEDK